jgi:hypothetical protein
MKILILLLLTLATSSFVLSQQQQQIGCFPGYFNPQNAFQVCTNPLCGSPEAPFLCQLPAGSNQPGYICLTHDQYHNGHPECLGGCLDLRMCGTNKCEDQCTQQECEAALQNGTMCPPRGPNSDPREQFICTQGVIQNFCGINQQCNNGSLCLLDNPSCRRCCNFANSCTQYETCKGIKCPQNVCDERSVCSWEVPFYCLEGQLKHGCSGDPHYFPENQCNDCCDLTTCYPLSCGNCPAEMCPSGINQYCPNPEFPVVCLNASSWAPGYQNACAQYGFWSTHPGCENCCSCP